MRDPRSQRKHVSALVWCAGLVLYALGMAVWANEQGSRPSTRYGGLSVAEWHERLKNIDPRVAPAPAVMDALLDIVADDRLPGVDREPFAVFLARVGAPAREVVPLLVPLVEQRAPGTTDYLWAARALALMGTPAKEATPALVDLVFDEDVPVSYRQSPVEALARIGAAHPDAIPAILELLAYRPSPRTRDVDAAFMRRLAADAVYVIGPEADSAAPLLIRMIRNPQEVEAVRRSALAALGALKERGAVGLNVLAEELIRGRSPALRDAAAEATVAIGREATPALLQFLEYPDPEVRWRAAFYVRRSTVRPTPVALISKLGELLEDHHPLVRISAAESGRTLVGREERWIVAAIELLSDQDRNVRIRAKNLLVSMAPLDKAQLELLKAARENATGAARKSIDATLKQLARPE